MSFSGPKHYRVESARALKDRPSVRTSVTSATNTFNANREEAYSQIESDLWRDWARDVKSHALTNLDQTENRQRLNSWQTVRRYTGQKPLMMPWGFSRKSFVLRELAPPSKPRACSVKN